jgi:P-type Mg2+ transporter
MLTTNQLKAGLTEEEAISRLSVYGQNVFAGKHKLSAFRVLVKQFQSALIYLLLIATLLAFILHDYYDGSVILAILLINTGLGFFQEYKSGKAVESLQGLLSRKVLAVRGGKEIVIDEAEVVPGDSIILKEGNIAPADIRVSKSEHLSADESQLSGESNSVQKSIGSIIYAGSTIAQGEGFGIVIATGFNTQLGKIAKLSDDTKRVTQYQKSLSAFSTFLMKMSLISLTVVFILKIVIDGGFSHITSLALFIVALSITVVPEALPVIATVTLSSGSMKLAKKHVLAKTLSAVEDLGDINILCTDKTGTLTENKQTIKRMNSDNEKLFQTLAFASIDPSLRRDKKHYEDTFDEAFIEFIPQEIQALSKEWAYLDELPFDPSARRRRVVLSNGHKTYLLSLGSLETILSISKKTHDHSAYAKQMKADALLGLRHLGISYKEVKYTKDFDIITHETSMTFLGYVALEDPLRPTAKHTIELAEKLGVTIKILSGDSIEVTGYVAKEVGLLASDGKVFSGDDLDKLTDIEATAIVVANSTFARLNPEQKYRIINLLKHQNNVVGYQGDGINDAPALKLADVAIAVNTATDVAKESADIILLRSDLGVIVGGIKYGRVIFANINKYIRYTMIGSFGNFFALSALYLLALNLPILAIQLLITSLLTDAPLIAISSDKVLASELTRPSKNGTHSLMFISLILGSVTALFELMYFALNRHSNLNTAQSGLFLFLTLSGLIVIFSVRNKGHFWHAPAFSPALLITFLGVALLSVAMLYIGFTQKLFSLTPLGPSSILIIIGVSVTYILVLDIVKVWYYRLKLAF